jgi:BirA family biotin operon repressor/biotin-[acetyl-CoA-carboxylase] ligase
MIGDAKLGGILVESSRFQGDDVVIIGIGINLAVPPEIDGRKVTHLAGHGPALAPDTLLNALAPAMTHWLSVWERGHGFEAIRAAWLARAHPKGQLLSVKGHDREYHGTFEGLGPDGRLELTTADGACVVLDHGDVALGQHRADHPE